MSRKRSAAALGATALSALLVGGVTFAPSAVATETESSAFAIEATGLVSIPKTPHVVGSGKESLVDVSLPQDAPIVNARALNAEAGAGTAEASVAELSLDLVRAPELTTELTGKLTGGSPKLKVDLIKVECEDGKASTTLAGVSFGKKDINVDQVPPNTTIPLDPLLKLVLNKQVENKDGSTTVTALSLNVLKGQQTLDLASATCGEGGDGGPTETSKPTDPTETSKPDETTKPGGGGDNGAGDRPDEDGKAPTPTPQPGHLDVTG